MKKPLSKAIKNFYGIGDMGFALMTSVELFCFVFFLTNVAKFSLPMVALIGSVTSIVDAVLSPFYGAIISGTKALKWGRNRSWMLIAPPVVVVLYMFQFTRIGPEPVAAAIVCAGFILSHIIWNIAWVGNVSLISVLANNPEERSFLAAKRGTWTSLAGVFFSYIGMPLALLLGSVTGNEVLGFTVLAGIMAFLMMLGYWTVFKITEGYEPIEEEKESTAVGAPKSEKISVSIMLKSIFQNPPLIVLLIGDFFRYMVNFIMTAAAAYYFIYVAQNMELFPIYLLVGAIGQVIGAYFSGIIAQKLTTRTAAIVGLFGLAASLIACKFVAMNITMFFVFVSVSRVFLGLLTAVMVGLYSDVVVYGEWKTGKNANAFIMGLMNLSLKTAIISRGTIIPIVLAAAGFVAEVDPAVATLELKTAVINVFLFIPGIFALVAAFIITVGYRLTREKVVAYQREIDQRKVQAEI
ncbi:glycoside/pentoside/hexuronide:cation symporter, GPH family [Anaerovirgula multivorans]|uniref:Glycoside/pentoside/hexuronide:cation symporter, GPH family n=1 Tax=Anaerovirgula multivorans TaxID=312168 RepID=A0A239D6R5_9FIRM|nr:MFS transporter [Anaerovirgula multivorans]SNS28030.1 glycoside/pentoside/hexuronide:cation symporter, GPH family [Anaerovirgula multivorans]